MIPSDDIGVVGGVVGEFSVVHEFVSGREESVAIREGADEDGCAGRTDQE